MGSLKRKNAGNDLEKNHRYVALCEGGCCPRTLTSTCVANIEPTAIDAYISSLPKSKCWVVLLVETVADWHKVDSKLVLSIITAESNFKVAAA